MSKIKNALFTAAITLSAFGAITYTACTKDECKDVVCNNGGSCAGGICSCPTGYQGANCQTKTRDQFVGTWKGSDICGSGTYSITLTIGSASASDVTALITNPAGFGTNIVITGTVTSSTTLTFTNADVSGGRTLTGTMTFSGGTSTTLPTAMSFAYGVKPATGATDNCNGTYTKQ